MENATITAKDLLVKLLEYQYIMKLSNEENSKPAKARLTQILVMVEAFGLSKKFINPLTKIKLIILGEKEEVNRVNYLQRLTDVEYLSTGEFINDKPSELYKELNEKVLSFALEDCPALPEVYKKRIDLQWLFQDLLEFRQEVYNLTRTTNGMLEGYSAALNYGWNQQYQLKILINNNLSDIDDTLCTILDPEKRIFDKRQINYVDVDLDKIDLEWRIENY